ncbi:Peptidoglycan-recognition protein LC [Frankliniella fusca]|uniref:Peptidoglycan-recognition protein LC n=1 Tax=Frankliniella fusca TaxID=407009 RepID=A0AAE1GU37_9NEOP|nr:Peptidoglycan-recognition protein LC [Frankliniella fusca]
MRTHCTAHAHSAADLAEDVLDDPQAHDHDDGDPDSDAWSQSTSTSGGDDDAPRPAPLATPATSFGSVAVENSSGVYIGSTIIRIDEGAHVTLVVPRDSLPALPPSAAPNLPLQDQRLPALLPSTAQEDQHLPEEVPPARGPQLWNSETNFALQLEGWRENMENFCGSKPPEGGCGSRQAQGFYPLWQPTASVFHGNRRFADCDPIAQFDRFDPRTTIGLPLEVRAVSRALDFLIPVSEALPQRGTRDSNPQPRVPTRSQNRKRPNAQSHRANGGVQNFSESSAPRPPAIHQQHEPRDQEQGQRPPAAALPVPAQHLQDSDRQEDSPVDSDPVSETCKSRLMKIGGPKIRIAAAGLLLAASCAAVALAVQGPKEQEGTTDTDESTPSRSTSTPTPTRPSTSSTPAPTWPPTSAFPIPRHEWGARNPSGSMSSLQIPVSLVAGYHISKYSHDGCKDWAMCAKLVRELQADDMDCGFEDIAYNFVLGGDGSVFEGRGWNVEGRHSGDESPSKTSILVAVVGYVESALWAPTPWYDMDGIRHLVDLGAHLGALENVTFRTIYKQT